MFIQILKSKIHRAVVTETNLEYVGSITVDKDLMDAAGILEYEQVLVANLNNGTRHETYVQVGKASSGIICLNGAAARTAEVGDKVIIMSFGYYQSDEQIAAPKIIRVDEKNRIIS